MQECDCDVVDGNASASLSVTLSIVGVTMQDKVRTVPITGTWKFGVEVDWDEVDPARYF